MPIDKDADYAFYLYTCNRCRSCTTDNSGREIPVCPSYSKYGFFAYSGGGKGYAAQGVLEGAVEPSAGLAEVAMNCLLCGACATMCPPGFEITAFIRDLRDHTVGEGFYVSYKHEQMLKNLEDKGNPWGLEKRLTPKELGAVDAEQAECLLFLGCHAGVGKSPVDNTLKLLKAADVKFAILDDEPCCASPALDLGNKELFENSAESLIDRINETGLERVVTLCPHCTSTLTNDYFEIGDLEAEVIHISEFLAELLADERLKPKDIGPKKSVAFHDPCHLGRYLERYDEPRGVLEALPGLEIKEMQRNREAALCCGAGGWSCELVPELATYTAQERLKDIKDAGVDTIITSCAYCKDWLGRLAADDVEVIDLVDLVADGVEI